MVELSIAEHRLAEATALASSGNEDDALVATSEYGEHMANAAAELAQVESLQPETATLVIQLQQRIDEHRATAAAVVARLNEDPNTISAAAALAPLVARGSVPADLSPAAAIAQDAADTADEAAAVAERKVTPARQTNTAPSSGGADRNTTPVSATPAADGQSVRGENAGGHGEKVSKKERAAGAARKAADEAKAAAKKAKAGAKRTPAPKTRDESNNRDD